MIKLKYQYFLLPFASSLIFIFTMINFIANKNMDDINKFKTTAKVFFTSFLIGAILFVILPFIFEEYMKISIDTSITLTILSCIINNSLLGYYLIRQQNKYVFKGDYNV